MTNTEPIMQEPFTTSSDLEIGRRRATIARRVSRVGTTIRSGVTTLAERAPGFVRTTQTRASDATTVLQHLPDSTLRWLAAGSLGVAAGFQLAGAPRLVTAAGAAPALIMGAAIALRPTDQHARAPARVRGLRRPGRAQGVSGRGQGRRLIAAPREVVTAIRSSAGPK